MRTGSVLQHALDFCLPALCPACQIHSGAELCESCCNDLIPIEPPCRKCGSIISNEHGCQHCHNRGIPGIRTVSVRYAYAGPMRTLILQSKIKARRSALLALCELLDWEHIQSLEVDLVTTIPPSPGRRYGPHLASTLAKTIAQKIERPFQSCFKQLYLPAAQHDLPNHLRQHNTADLFKIKTKQNLPKNILVVDDLLTSGNTLQSASKCLRQHGAQKIYAACVARTTALR